MAHTSPELTRTALAAAAACALGWPASGMAQSAPAADASSTIVITGRGPGNAGIAGFGDIAPARTPMQLNAYGAAQLDDAGITAIGGLTRLDASLGDAYNAVGYWSIIAARGYTLDNRFNYLRDGLPINAETALALDNKDRIEVLKGTSGIQAGSSAPGGLVNLVVKRPTGTVRTARIDWTQPGSWTGAIDLGERFGSEGQFGLRLNAALSRIDPMQRHAQGRRQLWSLAGDWQLGPDTLLQAEFESSHQSQPSVTAFSMLGNTVPAASGTDPRTNLNDQPWTQPVVLDGRTASLRLQQRLAADWTFTVHAMQQRLKSDDRTAFPYGVYDANYLCAQWCNRFAPDGSFTYWQYVSDNESRTSSALSLALAGKARTGRVEHTLEAGVLTSRYRGRFQDQVFDIAGDGNVADNRVVPPSPGTPAPNTNRDEHSTEVFVRDAMQLAPRLQLWAGLRHTRLQRRSELTSPGSDGTLAPTAYSQAQTLPWLALAHPLGARPGTIVYASWGQGLESDVAPNRSLYTNRGQALPALKSRQVEAGIKHESTRWDAALTLFDIDRPQAADLGECNADATCTRAPDGGDRHRGVEASGALRSAAWVWQGSAMWLQARRHGSVQPGVNGQRPTNVPATTLRLGAEYRVTALPGLALLGNLSAESSRVVLPDDQGVRIPGWSRIDLGARWRQSLGATTLVWRVGIDNVTDRRAWKESPYQFSHVYLYPLAPRTWRASVQAAF
jgi:iron complex outermembrane receptor protein